VRVATTCDALISEETAQALTGSPVRRTTWAPEGTNPVAYADERAGALICQYQVGNPGGPRWDDPSVSIGVLPTLGQNRGFDWRASDVLTEVVDGSYLGCADYISLCLFGKIVGGYQVLGRIHVEKGTTADQELVCEVRDHAVEVVAGLDEPPPLWQPAGGSLRGVTSPDGFLSADRIAAALGVETASAIKSEGGEHTATQLESAWLSGAYWSSFGVGNTERGVTIAVLPGGASYYDRVWRSLPAGFTESRTVGGIGDEAQVSTYRYGDAYGDVSRLESSLDVKVKNSWLQVRGTSPEGLEQLAREVIANLS
jgi:hypothetical protein